MHTASGIGLHQLRILCTQRNVRFIPVPVLSPNVRFRPKADISGRLPAAILGKTDQFHRGRAKAVLRSCA